MPFPGFKFAIFDFPDGKTSEPWNSKVKASLKSHQGFG